MAIFFLASGEDDDSVSEAAQIPPPGTPRSIFSDQVTVTEDNVTYDDLTNEDVTNDNVVNYDVTNDDVINDDVIAPVALDAERSRSFTENDDVTTGGADDGGADDDVRPDSYDVRPGSLDSGKSSRIKSASSGRGSRITINKGTVVITNGGETFYALVWLHNRSSTAILSLGNIHIPLGRI